MSNIKYLRKTGSIVLNPQNLNEVVLVFRKKQGDWSFPKGHVEVDEDLFQAVRRELVEETGLDVLTLANLTNLEYRDSKGNNVVVYMYLSMAKEPFKFKAENSGDEVCWVPLSEVYDKLTHKNLKNYFLEIKNIIRQYQNQN